MPISTLRWRDVVFPEICRSPQELTKFGAKIIDLLNIVASIISDHELTNSKTNAVNIMTGASNSSCRHGSTWGGWRLRAAGGQCEATGEPVTPDGFQFVRWHSSFSTVSTSYWLVFSFVLFCLEGSRHTSLTCTSGFVSFQVGRRAGPPRRATAAAKTTRATARAEPPSTTSPPPAPRASRRPAPHRAPSSVGRSAARRTLTPTSRPWTGRRRRAPSPCCSSPSTGGRATCCARSRPAPATPAARSGRWRRSWPCRRSWRSASKISARSRFRRGSRRGSTCGRRTCWGSTASETGLEEQIQDPASVYTVFWSPFATVEMVISFKST